MTVRTTSGIARRGVSLLEVLAVVVLATAALTAGVFKFSPAAAHDPAKQAAHELSSALRDARDLAVKHGTPVDLVWDLTGRGGRWMIKPTNRLAGESSDRIVAMPRGVTVDGTTVPIRFNSSGNASYTGTWTLCGEQRYEVTLAPVGAKVAMRVLQ